MWRSWRRCWRGCSRIRAVTGIAEPMLNAIEHGNLEIGHERKADWVARGINRSELAKRLATPPFSAR